MSVRVGVLGAGSMGAGHARCYATMPGVELAGVVGRGLERAGPLAKRLGTKARDDPRWLLEDPSVDAVSVATPTALHRELVVAALRAGKHVLCETPLAADLEDADAMIRAAREHGRQLLVDQTLRAVTECRVMRETVCSGELGRPLVLTTSRLYPGNDADHHGDALLELALFDLDLALWALGPAASVSASGIVQPDGWVDHAFVQLEHWTARASLEASLRPPKGFVFRAAQRMVFEEGLLDFFIRFPAGSLPESIFLRYAKEGPPERLRGTERDPLEAICEHFVRCVRGDDEPGALSAGEARASLAVLASAREALAAGEAVRLAP